MIQPLRKFSVIIFTDQVEGTYTAGKAYPVLGLDQQENDDNCTVYLLLADDLGNLYWEDWNQVKVVSIDD